FPGRELPEVHPHARFDPNLPVKSVSLIGSMGSIAQGPKSDFDYWICIDRAEFGDEQYSFFIEKLRAIETWADEFAGAEVHCFPLSIDAIIENDFGEVDAESSGTAQGILLKEEYYRTMTLVCGQVPLWWVMPPGVTDEEYDRLKEVMAQPRILNRTEFVELGNVHDISLGEFYGATIWQINKTISYPFKSVLKLALLEEYLFSQGKKGLLCNDLKERLLSGVDDTRLMDPYMLMFDRASEFFIERERYEDLDLLRQSLFLKSGVKPNLADHRRTDLPRKSQVMVNYIRKWQWNHRQVDRLSNYSHWSLTDMQEFNEKINRYLIKTYQSIAKELRNQSEDIRFSISPRDQSILGKKLFVFYSRRTNKVESILSVGEEPPSLRGLTLQQKLGGLSEKKWHAYRGLFSREVIDKGDAEPALLIDSPFLTEILVWLVRNRIYKADTAININQTLDRLPNYTTLPDIQVLLKAVQGFLVPVWGEKIEERELLEPPRTVRMFMAVNVDAPEWSKEIVNTALCFLNNWGELFFKGYSSDQGIYLARNFVQKYFAYNLTGAREHLSVFLPKHAFHRDLSQKLNKFFGFNVV
ncbi:MAG: class I adenylate cyclase, partial [Deltaproteobacteria bacterium]|nr:class I adenylate cyclase [Deltaproteobacteria bacterium]